MFLIQMQRKTKISLAKRNIVRNEQINVANRTLINLYNEIWDAGDYFELACVDGTKEEKASLKKCFKLLLNKASRQMNVVRNIGGEPVPFPGRVYRLLPETLQVKRISVA